MGGSFSRAGGKPASDFTIWRLPPAQSLARAGGSARISWPAAATGYRLECADSLGQDSWRNVTNGWLIIDHQIIVTLDVAGRSKFYRLQKP